MIYGIGIDIVAVHRMQENIEQYAERFARKILDEEEMLEYSTAMQPAHYLAKHFAAKEALVKALGTGFRDGINLRDIHIQHAPSGRPEIRYNGKIAETISANGVAACHLTVSDEKEYACACVILEK